MRDAVRSRSPSPDAAAALHCRPVDGPGELAVHHAVRAAVFVDEQALFALDDRDARDDDPATVHVLGFVGGVAAGTVRLHPLGGGLWQGDRLAVLRPHRRSGIGRPLVRFAVAMAAQRGGRRMDAQVQAANVAFFQALGWTAVGDPHDHLGLLHQRMTIALEAQDQRAQAP